MSEPPTAPARAAPSGDTLRIEDQVGFQLRRAYQKFSANLSSRLSPFGLTVQQFTTLAKLREVGSVSQNHLGRMVSMDPAAIHGVIRRLAERGLIALSRNPDDQRMVMVSLSADGEALVDRASPIARESQNVSLGPLTARETERLLQLLSRLGEE